MPYEAGSWQRGRFAMLRKAIPWEEKNDQTRARLVKPMPGDIGVIAHVNTSNGEADSVAMLFRGASWVIDVDYLEHE